MDHDLIETMRGWIIEQRVGLITREQLIQRADAMICSMDEPPDLLISLSCDESMSWVPRLDLLLDRVSDRDCPRIARILLDGIDGGSIDAEEVSSVSTEMAQLLRFSSFESECRFIAVSDDIDDRMYRGIDPKEALDEARITLDRIAHSQDERACSDTPCTTERGLPFRDDCQP